MHSSERQRLVGERFLDRVQEIWIGRVQVVDHL